MARQKDLLPKRPNHGRPRISIDWETVRQLLQFGCSTDNIASYLGISSGHLRDCCQLDHGILWTDFARAGKAKGEIPLRQKQYEMAIGGDVKMLIHLGKVRLKQYAYEPNSNKNDSDLLRALLAVVQNRTRDPLNPESFDDDDDTDPQSED